MWRAGGTRSSWKGALGQVGLADLVGLPIHVGPPTSEGHNFFVRTPFRVFLDSMEIPLSQDCSHVPLVDIGKSG